MGSIHILWWIIGSLSILLYPLLFRRVASGTEWVLNRILPKPDDDHVPN